MVASAASSPSVSRTCGKLPIPFASAIIRARPTRKRSFTSSRISSCGVAENVSNAEGPSRSRNTWLFTCGKKSTASRVQTPSSSHSRNVSSSSASCSLGPANRISSITCCRSNSGNSSGATPMHTRLERSMRSKVSAMMALTPGATGPLAAHSRDKPQPYSLPTNITNGVFSLAQRSAAS